MRIKILLPFVFLLFIFSPDVYPQQNHQWYRISKFVDGDTFWVANEKQAPIKIRLIGIDAPESRKSGKKEVDYFGKEASVYLEKLLTGRRLRLEYDVTKNDRYKRTLAYVFMEDGTFLNAHLVENGYAMVMTVPPNVKYADLFVKLQNKARIQKRGLWGRP